MKKSSVIFFPNFALVSRSMFFKKIFLASLLLAFCLSHMAKSKGELSKKIERFDVVLKKLLEEDKVPGLAVALVSSKGIEYLHLHGVKDTETKEPVDGDTIFRICSVTKFISALLVCVLENKSVLNTKLDIKYYLPELSFHPKSKFKTISLHNLLSHTVGAASYSLVDLEDKPYMAKDLLLKRCNRLSIAAKPGGSYAYQNVLYSLIRHVVEKTNGNRPYSDSLKKEIFAPLGIKDFTILDKEYNAHKNATKPHVYTHKYKKFRKLKEKKYYDNIAAAGGLGVSIKSFSKLIQALLDDKGSHVNRVLLKRMTSGKIQVCGAKRRCSNKYCLCKKNLSTYYGLGCRIIVLKDKVEIVYHAGALAGYSSIFAIIPNEDIGIVVFTNIRCRAPSVLFKKFVKLFTNYGV